MSLFVKRGVAACGWSVFGLLALCAGCASDGKTAMAQGGSVAVSEQSGAGGSLAGTGPLARGGQAGNAGGTSGGEANAGGGAAGADASSAGAPTTSSAGMPATGGGKGGEGGAGGANDGGGTAGAAGSGTAGAVGVAYNPCPASGVCKIMPLGDSITAGTGSTDLGGYRVEIFRRAVAAAQSITFVGRSVSGPTTVSGKPFPRSHEGHPGYLIDTGPERPGILPLIDAAFAANMPNIVLLMIGTNDIPWMLDLANEPMRLGVLIDKIISVAPKALIVVAQIGPTSMDDRTALVQAYNAGIPAVVAQRAAAGKHVIMVDMFTAFTSNPNYKTALLFDEVHPNDAGHVILGGVWYNAIKALLPHAP
jgi:lysophospholipase L1-like esterase